MAKITIDEAIKDMQDGYILEIEQYNKICEWLEELKKLRLGVSYLNERAYQQGRADAIDECIKLFDVCTCEKCNECSDKEYNKSMCASDSEITYKQIITMLNQLKENSRCGE